MQSHFFPSETHPHGPFPSAAEKEALAEQTGLSVNQVSDWFVNARARWWKPMIEGMHRGLCDPDDEPAAALPAVAEDGDGDTAMDAAELAAAGAPKASKPRTHRRRNSSGVGLAPPRMQEGGRAQSRRGTADSDDLDDVVAALGIAGGV